MRHVNFLQTEIFEWKFKRKPKVWSVDDVHALWLKAKERNDNRHKQRWDYILEITREIPADDQGCHIVYYTTNNREYKYVISYDKRFKSHSISSRDACMDNRDDKISYWMSNEKSFEMGQKLYEMTSKFQSEIIFYSINQILWENIVFDKLRKKYRDEIPPASFVLKVGTKNYIISCDSRYDYYHKFTKCEYNGEIITL